MVTYMKKGDNDNKTAFTFAELLMQNEKEISFFTTTTNGRRRSLIRILINGNIF